MKPQENYFKSPHTLRRLSDRSSTCSSVTATDASQGLDSSCAFEQQNVHHFQQSLIADSISF